MLSSGMQCYHLELMLSSGANVIRNVIILANVIILDKMLSSGMKCYHLGRKCYHLELMLSSGMKWYHLG
jgi:hypothetical protein